jgi:transcriptional regulator with XRE-family HTH domain
MRGISQQTIADAIGISRSAYSSYELGRAEPDVNLIRQIARFYHVSIDFLLSFDLKSVDPELDELRAQLWTHLAVVDKETAQMILNLFTKFGKN